VTAVEDPGWLPAVKALPRHLIPFVDLWSMRGSRTRRRGLIAVRTTHLSMAASLVSFVVAFSFVTPDGTTDATPVWPWIVVIGATGLGLFEIVSTERRMDLATDEPMAATGFTVIYFLRLGFAMTPALFGITLFLVTGTRPLYLLGVVLGEFLLWLIAPSRRNLARRTARYRASGKDIDITRALMTQGPPPGASE